MAASVTYDHPVSPARSKINLSRILEFDGLRAIAILLVMACHYSGFANRARRIPEFGWIGVDIFFALSGYLITTILLGLRGRRTPYRTFYSRRMIRILPPYLATTAVFLIIAVREHWKIGNFIGSQLFFMQALPEEARRFCVAILQHPWYSLTHLPPLLANAHHLSPSPVGLTMQYGLAPPTYWSLSIEEYFYLLWAPIVLRLSRRSIVSVALAVCLVEMLLRWMTGSLYAYFWLFCRFDALLYGALLAILFEHWRRRGIPRWAPSLFGYVLALSVVGIASILFAIRPVIDHEVRSSVLAMAFGLPLFSIGVSALMGLLFLRAGGNWWLSRVLRLRALLFIGTISYTMYLIHVIAGSAVASALRKSDLHWSDTTQALLSTILTILVAYASWHFLEKPLLRWKDSRFPNAPHPAEPQLS
jgi:peptidoglycan/LPS O-acetylase OafA/YrhL